MSPLNRGPLMGPRIPPRPPVPMRPPMHRYGRAPLPPPPGMTRGMPPPPMNPMYGPRGRPIPPMQHRPGPMMARPVGPPCPPMFGPRGRPMPPMPLMPPMGLRGPMGPRGPLIRPGPRGMLPPHALPHMRPRFPPNHNNVKGKMNNAKKATKLEELELKKPWMTDEIRTEIQKKNKLYAKAKKNKDAKEWEEFKDLRNKVTRMIRDAKNEFLAKNPEQVAQKTADKSTVQKESVQKTENTTEQTEQTEQTELNGESKPSSEQAHLYENDEEIPEVTDEDVAEFFGIGSGDEEPTNPYCEVCDRDFDSEERLERHLQEHQTCRIDGCTFTAHPKIVEKHISMQHSTGLYERMKHVMSDEDIDKWRAERKKRYPTAATIKIQEDERLEKKKRGEVIRNQRESQKIGNPRREHVRKTRKRKRNKPFQTKVLEETLDREVYRGLLPFAGTAMLDEIDQNSDDSLAEDPVAVQVAGEEKEEEEKCEFQVSDEDEEIIQPNVQPILPLIVEEPAVTEPLKPINADPPKIVIPQMLGLVADYGSDSDDDEPPDEVPIKKSKPIEAQIEPTDVAESITETTLGTKTSAFTPKDDKKYVVRNKKSDEDKRKPNRPQRRNNSEHDNGRLRLLNRLLARSIQHERNAIYQSITFIANNNFFE